MYLLFVILLLCVISAILTDVVSYIIVKLNRPTKKEKELHKTLVNMKNELDAIPMVDNFVAHAKLQRKFNTIENTLKQETNKRLANNLKYKIVIPNAFNLIVALMIVYFGFVYRYSPVIVLKNFDLSPFSSILSYPLVETGAVSVHAWFCVCKIVTKYVISR